MNLIELPALRRRTRPLNYTLDEGGQPVPAPSFSDYERPQGLPPRGQQGRLVLFGQRRRIYGGQSVVPGKEARVYLCFLQKVLRYYSLFEDPQWRRVAEDEIGEVRISTGFLGIDHSFDDGPPVLFETMIFGGSHDGEQWRYCTKEEALEGHKEAVALAMQPVGQDRARA